MDQHVIALFYQPEQAARALESVVGAGVQPDEISLFWTESGASEYRQSTRRDFIDGLHAAGTTGADLALGGTTRATNAGGAEIVAVGPLLLVATAAFRFGATIGGIVAALSRAGVPTPIAACFAEEVREADAVLIGVHILRHEDGPIATLLRRCGGASVMATASPIFVL